MKKFTISKTKLCIILLFALYAIRMINLDADMPNWGVTEYTPIDEGYYAMQAYQNVNHNGMQSVTNLLTDQYRLWNSSLSLFNTIFCTLTMKIFGNNYYGLRMSSVIAGAIIILIIMLLMLRNNEKKSILIPFLLGIFMIFNFSFEIASRIVEPGIYRMLILCCGILFFYLTYKKEALCYVGMGVLAMWSLIFGYITNVFVFVPIGMMLLYHILWNRKIPVKKIMYLISGGIGGYLVGEIIYFVFQKRWFFQDMQRVVLGREIRRATFSMEYLVWNLKAVLQGNMFGYNAAFLILSVLGVLYCAYLGHKKKDYCFLYISWICIGFGAQGMFTSDFLIRKSVTIFPILILNIYYLLVNGPSILIAAGKNKKLLAGTIALILSVTGCALILSIKRIQNVNEFDMNNYGKNMMILLNVISVCGVLFFILLKQRMREYLVYAGIIVSLLLPNLYMNYRYIYTAEKTEKEMMLDMKEFGNGYVLGGDIYAYCLYNDLIPVSSCYDNYFPDDYNARAKELLKRADVNYYIGYNDTEMINAWLADSLYKWELVKQYKVNYTVVEQDEDHNDIFVYKKILR